MVTANYKSLDIYLFESITEESASSIVVHIDELNRIFKNKNRRITLHIDSGGGYLHSTFSIVESMLSSELPVDVKSYGNVASGAFIIFLNGENKYISNFTRFMWHDASYGVYYSSTEKHREHVVETDIIRDMIDENIKSNSNLTQDDLDEIYEKKIDKWYSAKEMFDLLSNGSQEMVEDVETKKSFFSKLRFW